MKKAILLVAAALLVPSAALAATNKGPKHSAHGKGSAKVMYVLKGTLSAYMAYDSGTNTPGSITIDVTRANHHGKALVGQTLTIPVDAKTRIVFGNGTTTVTDGDKGIVKVRAAKNVAASDLASTLEAGTAFQAIDQGTSTASDSGTGNGQGHGHGHGKGAHTVMYVLKGTLSGFTAYDSATSTAGSITIALTRANHHGKALVGQTLTIPVGATTKITLHDGATTVTDGDKGIVKVRAAKNVAASDLASTLEAATVFQVLDQTGTSSG